MAFDRLLLKGLLTYLLEGRKRVRRRHRPRLRMRARNDRRTGSSYGRLGYGPGVLKWVNPRSSRQDFGRPYLSMEGNIRVS